jgi:hypothetical protein
MLYIHTSDQKWMRCWNEFFEKTEERDCMKVKEQHYRIKDWAIFVGAKVNQSQKRVQKDDASSIPAEWPQRSSYSNVIPTPWHAMKLYSNGSRNKAFRRLSAVVEAE